MHISEQNGAGKRPAAGSQIVDEGSPASMFSEQPAKTAWRPKLILAALLGFAFFSPWSIAGAQICLGLSLLFWMIDLFAHPHRRAVLSALFWPLVLYLGVQFLSILFSSDPVTGLWAVRAEWIILLFFLVINVVDDDKKVRHLVGVLVLTTVLVSLYAIWQHWSGWDLYRGRPLRATGNFFEATGLFGHHLTFGGYLMMVLMLSISLLLFGIRGRARIFYALSSLALFLALVFSYARSAWIGCLVGALGMAILRGRRATAVILPIGVVIVVLAALFLPSVQEQAGEAVAQVGNPLVTSARLQIWPAAWRLIADYPLLGAGVGQAAQLLSAYGCDLECTHLHNDLINVAANSGLLGLAAFLWIWVTFLCLTVRCQRRLRETPWAAAMATAGFGIIIALLAAGQFQCYYTDAEDGMLLWFLMGLVMVACVRKGKPAGPPASRTDSARRATAE